MHRIYRNLTKGCWSIQGYLPGKGWRLAYHADRLIVDDITFKVYEAGRQRVIREGRKNVHAYIVADYLCDPDDWAWPSPTDDEWADFDEPNGWVCRYNPYEGPHFMAEGHEVDGAAKAFLGTFGDVILNTPHFTNTNNKENN